jgi:putative ABC transport system permease protein
MQIRPIFAALRRHRMASFLIAMEIALACAILCNALFMIINRVQLMQLQSGIDESRLVVVSITGVDANETADMAARMKAGFAGITGVESVAIANAVPFTPRAGEAGFRIKADDPHYNQQGHFYVGDVGFAKTLGLRLVAGRWFGPDDYGNVTSFLPASHTIMVDRSYAEHLWPGESALGKQVYAGDGSYQVVGIYDRLARPDPSVDATDNTFVTGGLDGRGLSNVYVLRTAPDQRLRVLADARALVLRVAPTVVVDNDNTGTLSDLRRIYFASDRAMARLLIGVIAALLMVTALGIVGLASFWVGQRRKQIGVRRALGARRVDILRYFQIENFLIVSGGIAVGMVLTFGVNLLLMEKYELPRLPWIYLPTAAVALWVLGQLAVLAPALRAAAVPPVEATRSV